MAGQIKVDSINADSNLALKIANTAVAFIDSSGLRPTSGNVNLDATATSKFYLPSANTVAIQTAGVTGLSISSAQVVTLANALAVTSGGTGVTTSTGTGAVVLGTSPTLTTPTFDSASLPTISGTAPLYMCRAWVNFNGTGTVAIRGSGNVSSITDNGTGDYTVNFTTAMVDANYASPTCSDATSMSQLGSVATRVKSTASIQIYTAVVVGVPGVSARTFFDLEEVNISIFR